MKKIIIVTTITILFITACNGNFGRLLKKPEPGVVDTTPPVVSNKTVAFPNVDYNNVTVNWQKATDDTTPQSSLQYMVLRSSTGSIGTITDPDNLPADVTSLDGWTDNIASYNAASLSTGTPYYFSILVRDTAGNFSQYDSGNITPEDLVLPTVATGTISASQTMDSITLTWTEATDNLSSQANLTYKIVISDAEPIKSVEQAEALSSQSIAQNWTAYSSPATISSLQPNTKYNFNILVRDENGNRAIFTASSITTDPNPNDTQAPELPSDATITITSAGSDFDVTLSWNYATDPAKSGESQNTADANLQYRVATSSSPITESNFNNATVLTDVSGDKWDEYINTLTPVSVADGAETYFCVAVKDLAGNISYYTTASYVCSSYQSSLLAHYKLDGDANDSSTNGRNGSIAGSPSFSTDAAIGQSLDFAGNDNESMYINIPDGNAFTAATDMITISFWIRVASFTNSWETIISKGGHGFRVERYADTDRLYFNISHDLTNTLQSRAISTDGVADDKWHHIAATFSNSGSNAIYIYIDGNLQTGSFGTGGSDNWYNAMSTYMGTDAVHIGNNADSTNFSSHEFTGKVDDMRIYHEAMTADQIKILAR